MADLARMVQTIRQYGVADMRVVQAIGQVDRQAFVPARWSGNAGLAYEDRALPIGFGQTTSQPYTIARMCELLVEDLKTSEIHNSKVLEIGTGSGWQTAILAKLFKQVYSIEKIPQLVQRAKKVIDNLGFRKVKIKVGDGKLGWPEHAPYPAIIVAADAQEVPPALIDQLAEKGRIVIPVREELKRGTKIAGVMKWEAFEQYLFVPLV